MSNKLLSGAFWLSFSSVASRVLGVIYLIPWLMMLGSPEHQTIAQALFNTAYTPYALFIALGTAGFPSAIARRVAFYKGQQDEASAQEIGKVGFLTMLVSGIICGILLFLLAPTIAKNSPVNDIKSATVAVRCLVPAIVILPSMSALRGWLQGSSDLKSFGLSQLWEQTVRVLVILLGTYLVIFVLHKDFKVAVFVSIFAAFLGGLVSYLYVTAHVISSSYHIDYSPSNNQSFNNIVNDFTLVIKESIPFVLVGSGISICQLIDQLFFKQIMVGRLHFSASHTQYIFTVFSANPNKITTVLISIALSASETVLPLISAKMSNVAVNKNPISQDISSNLRLVFTILLPVSLLVSAFSLPIYSIFFNYDKLGATYLIYNVIQSFILGVAFNALTILQALRMSKKATVLLSWGILIKLVLQYPLVYLFQGAGAILSTAIAFTVVGVFSLITIQKYYHFTLDKISAFLGVITIFTVAIVSFSVLANSLGFSVHFQSKLFALIYVSIAGLLACYIYIVLINHYGISKATFGKKIGLKYFRYRHFE